jgi:hypothetical protein
MAHADAAALQRLLPLLRQLRELPGVREKSPGIFHCRGAAFAHFNDEQGVLIAELKKPAGSGFDRFPVDSPAGQRKLIDEAKRRAARADED